MKGHWTCQRVTAGKKCGMRNSNRYQICGRCGKRRAARKRPAHMKVLEQPYEWWAERFGDRCNICGRSAGPRRRLDRDHCHVSGDARGLLCHRCNRALPDWMTEEWLRKAADYLARPAITNPQVEVEFPSLDEARAEHARAVIKRQDNP